MTSQKMKSMLQENASSYLYGSNMDFIEELYENYLDNPGNVSDKWKKYFDSIQDEGIKDKNHSEIINLFSYITKNANTNTVSSNTSNASDAQIKVWTLIDNYRKYGVQMAKLDPLERYTISQIDELNINKLGLTQALNQEFYINTNCTEKLPLKDIINKFNNIYTDSIGFEYSYITNTTEREWLQDYIENQLPKFSLSKPEQERILLKLTEAEALERVLNTKYVGQKRFSIEGGESIIPALDRLIDNFIAQKIQELYIGMAHRGRLNVLVNINGKLPAKIFSEFDGNYPFPEFMTSGDVKYHKGYQCAYTTQKGAIKIQTLFNPSHLETVNPVLNGVVRARQDAVYNKDTITGIIIHGDSALIGLGTNQGVFNMSQTRAYGVNGIIHVVINNQVGFTTSTVEDVRSSRYCTDIAKMIDAPIIHVNGDDVEHIMFVMDLATQYRATFKRDIMIDVVGFRKYGHNEADDPSITQPLMYRKVKEHIGVRSIYIQKLVKNGVITQEYADKLFEEIRMKFTNGEPNEVNNMKSLPFYNDDIISKAKQSTPFDMIDTKISVTLIHQITKAVTHVKEGFTIHPTIQRVVITPRTQMGEGTLDIDFGMAEMLAYGSLLNQGINVRLCGEDSRRGTFAHRHAVWHNYNRQDINEDEYIPLKQMENKSIFSIYDSILNEECALGFEYGYAGVKLNHLTIWEAQFGDFANGAQVIIDQYIASSEAKWGIFSNVTMLLPHGYDGDGPEHSSARLERYLQLSAEHNMQIVVPSTAAQMFHVLRRKSLTGHIKPLIIFMSKKLLRNKDAASKIKDFTDGEFEFIIKDKDVTQKNVTSIILCSGQVYYNLVIERKERKLDDKIAIIRIEQLYPFPVDLLTAEIHKYKTAKNITWVQEEPYNQGAWLQIQDTLNEVKGDKKLHVVSRDRSAATACGLGSMHLSQLKTLMDKAFSL